MKTIIQIPDPLLKELRKLANEENTTLKSLTEEGVRRIISVRKRRGKFKLRKATSQGKGLQPGLGGASWDRIRDVSYEGRGA